MDTLAGNAPPREYADGKMLAAKDGGIGFVTFNQPEKRNAMSVEMWQGLAEILDDFREDSAVRVVIMTGAGGKAFVSGADISQFEKRRANADAQEEYARLTSSGRAQLADFPKPKIAAIQGFCLGGGLAIAMQADLRIASANSQFGIPAARLGIAYTFDGLRTLVELVGPAHARMILYTGTRIGADEAARIGLINKVVPEESLTDSVLELARTIAGNAPLSVAANKLCIDNILKDPADRDLDAVARAGRTCLDSADYREGRTAFMEKRQPRFQGR
ncbi:MAG: enoyl-CoA hydratase/isomerase family protein [Hyphomicrobiales bacterium]|nr:enoyl-CoA hydratase/isomerase family protein [Hyphomicrobiales bacterium]MBV8825105.1 enoyl-CoA hydratase/isomerase family protein [Hyphomicrobiales bacterium]MBV9429255.1 enoyl-CoA hydratase/isomerase family protein [Bradyrhizobiaceae bacterium]